MEFLRTFPNIHALAKAPLGDILRAWRGMGYNRRAKYLKQCAEAIVGERGGHIPKDYRTLIALPGIGPSTAGGILAFAYNNPIAYIETNIRRVYIHHFFKKRRRVSDKEILKLVEKTLDTKNPREWYWALMDYGSALPKTVANPNRKSTHYTQQAPFAGSNREVRGDILRLLATQQSVSMHKLREHIRDARLRKNLDALTKEGFIKKTRASYTLG
jgi:A/G-specific adenine glycosylase